MSNKANWVAAIAGVVAAGAAVVTLVIQQPDEISSPPAKGEQAVSNGAGSPSPDSKPSCVGIFEPMFESVSALSLGIDRDDGYKNIVSAALKKGCYKQAIEAAGKLSLGIYRDENYKAIYRSAIDAGQYDHAKASIDKLSLDIYRDEGYRLLLEAAGNET